ncbi:MAG: tRNA dihydrouridine synthase DusB [candidate division Zixibacteria bacterium]|nr:tRNA dihydrouridine synthase DusB [candidate division Zixibacteria bacterium]
MKIGNLIIDGNLFSAPLAGISDSVFRRICRRYGADAVVSEMVSARGLSYRDRKTLKYLEFSESERPIGIQLFSPDADSALRGLEVAIEVNPDFIDFNLGCPVKKVQKQGSGGVLMKDPGKTTKILKRLVENSPVPVTAKMRSGWDSASLNFPELAERLQDVGVSAVFIHPRTVVQSFRGKPNRKIVAETVKILKIPVIYSGDIKSPEDTRHVLEQTGVEGIMIGRAAMGDPQIFFRVKQFLATGESPPEPAMEERINRLIEFYEEKIDYYDEQHAVRMMRKFVVWFTRGMPGNSQLRKEIFHIDNYGEVIEKLSLYRDRLSKR